MLLEDFVKTQQPRSVSPGGAGSVEALTQLVNRPEVIGPSPSVPASVPEQSLGTDLKNLAQTFGARVGANWEQAAGGLLQWLTTSDEPVKTLYGDEHDKKMQAVVDSYKEHGKELGEEGRRIKADVEQDKPTASTYPGKIATGVVESLGQMVPALGAGVVGGVPAALGVISGTQFGQTYDESIAKGMNTTDAGENAFIQGATEGLTELIPFATAAKFFKPGSLAKKVGTYLLSDVPGEHVATAVQNTTGKYFEEKDPEKRKQAAIDYFFSKEHGQDQLDTFWTTIVQGGLLTGGAAVTHKIGGAKQTQQPAVQSPAAPITQPMTEEVSSAPVVDAVNEADVLSRLRQQVTQLTEPVTPEELGVEGVQSEQPSTAAAGTVQPENVGATEPSPVSSPDATPADAQVQQVREVGQPDAVDLSVLRNPSLAQEVVTHFTQPVKEDNLVIASPTLQTEANFAEDLLISTGVRSHVGIFSADDITANPEIAGLMSGVVGEFASRHQLKGNAGSIARIKTAEGTKYVVSIDPKLKNDVERLTTVTHEAVGHVVAFERFDAATLEQKADIEKDFAAFVDRVHGAKTKEERAAVSREFFPFSIKSPSSVNTEYATALMDDTNVGKEWLANRITEWALSDKKPQTRAEKWFKGLANRLKKIFAKAQDQRTANQLPVQSVNEWLNSIYNPSLLDSVEKSNQNEERVVERHTGKVAKSLSEERRILEKTVSPEELARFVVGKSANGNPNSVDVSVKMDGGTQVVLKTITSTSRSSAIREANLFKLRAAAGAQNIVNVSRPISKRMEFYRKTLAQFKQVIQEYADDNGLSFNQTWLNFLGDPLSFKMKPGAREVTSEYVNPLTGVLETKTTDSAWIFNRLKSIAEHNKPAWSKLVASEKQVVPKETQETEQTEKEINQELEQPVEVPVENSKQNVGTENTFEGRIISTAQDAVTAMLTAGTKVNLERVQSNVEQRLRLTGQDAKLARKVVEREWERLKSGQVAAPVVDVPVDAVGVPDDVSDEEAQAFLASIDDFAAAAWHGSPHSHNKFSTEKIGTGEGAQVYGWGLYFASRRKVAEWYRERLASNTSGYNDEILYPDGTYITSGDDTKPGHAKAYQALYFKHGNYADAIAHLNEQLASYEEDKIRQATDDNEWLKSHTQEAIDMYKQALAIIEQWRQDGVRFQKVKKPGKLYQVELAPEEDEYLLWDKPFSEQSEKVQWRLKLIWDDLPSDYKEEIEDRMNANFTEMTGAEIYTALKRASLDDMFNDESVMPHVIQAQEEGNNAKAISLYLHDLRVRGIKYLDGSSRSRGEGAYNYVIFNDEDVKIVDIHDFARKAKTKEEIKEQKIKDTLYKEVKPPRKKKVLTPEEQEKKEAAKLERRSKKEQEQREMLKTLIKAAETAKSKGLALTEYLLQNGFSDEENVKMMRLYLQHQGSIFSQREQIYRLAIDLGLYNSVTGDQGLQDFIKGVFPKSYGTLDTLGIRGRDIIVTRLQQMHEQMLGHELDFTTVVTMKDVKAAKEKEFESLSFRRKAHLFINTLMDRMQDGLNTTPHGAQLVWNLKQVIGAQYSLYARDYMTHIDKFKKDVPNVEDREKIGEKYRNGEQGDTEAERRAIALMRQISKSYGMEMERLGFKIYYDSKHQELFKFNPEENYFPRIWEDGTFEDKNKVRQMANELVRSGRAINEKEARKLINNFRRRYHRLRVPSYANMEMARETDMGGWIKDPAEVFARYVASGSRRLAVMRVLGPTAEAKLLSMARDHYVATDDPDSFEDAVSVINSVLGSAVNPNKSAKTSWGVDELQFAAIATMLQHSSLLQPGVAANVIGRIGWKKTLVGFSKILAPNKHTREQNLARGYALGVAERFIAKEIFDNLDADGSARDRADKLLRTWKVTSIDRWMRAGTALAGEMHVMETFSNFVNGDPKARRELAKLYVDADQMKQAFDNGDEEHVKDWVKMGAFQLTQQTNFATDALTMPQWLKGQSPWLNLLTLFSRFSFHQAKYWSDLVRQDKSKVANQLLAQVAFGAPIYLLRLLAKGIDPWKELEKDSLLKTLWGMLLSGSGLGLFAEAAINALSGTTSQSAGGPVASTLQNWAGVSGKAARGVFSGEGLDEHGYHSALQKLIDAGIYGAARFLPAPIGVPLAAALGFAAPAIKRNILPVTNQQEETNWTGR